MNKEKNKEIQATDNQSKRPYIKLDYTITDVQKRNEIVHKIIQTTPREKLTPYYLEELTKYLVITPQAKKEKSILTDNRMITINKREVSFEGLVAKLENGEDGIYNFMTGGDKDILFIPKIEITEDDIKTVPGLKELREEIVKIQAMQKAATGKRKYLLTKQLIEMRRDQYVLKNTHKQPISLTSFVRTPNQIVLNENISIDENGEPIDKSIISFFNPSHICCILCSYSKLKQAAWGRFENDLYYLMEAFDELADKALKNKYPILYDIMIYKIDGLSNKDILEKIKKDHDTTYSTEYLSALWRKKIPKVIAETAKEDWIVWYYTMQEKGKWKRCSRCHKIKLAHSYFFTKNKTSKDGWYSLCKECRNKKK